MTSHRDPQTGDNLAVQNAQERDAATREILQVISRSRDDYGPVFDVILENAVRLCSAPLAFLALANTERTHLDLVGYRRGISQGFVDLLEKTPLPLDANAAETSRAVIEKKIIHIEDLSEGRLYAERQPHRVRAVEVGACGRS